MKLPSSPTLEPAIPFDLQSEIEKSVIEFERQFPAMFQGMVRSQGWLEKYRLEITRLVTLALHASERERAHAASDRDPGEARQHG